MKIDVSKPSIFDWRTVTSKARSAAGKHFLMTNKVLGSISRIMALRWVENYDGENSTLWGWKGSSLNILPCWGEIK